MNSENDDSKSTKSKPAVSYRFLPIVRRGFRPQSNDFDLNRPKKKGSSGALTGPLKTPVKLTLEARKKEGFWTTPKENAASKDVHLFGPGDVQGIDTDQIVRVEPEPRTSDFSPNYFPMIEFARPALPWLFSPERTVDDTSKRARNRPWLALVVVDKEKASLKPDAGGALPVLEAPPSELPPPSETWAWAHAQIVGESDSSRSVIEQEPTRAVSRLLCPRNLHRKADKNPGYIAAVVPTFEPGRRAGLGMEPYPESKSGNSKNKNATKPIGFAWTASGSKTQKLPAYYTWEFTVGDRDFETMVTDLRPAQLSTSDAGTRKVDVSHPGPEKLIPNAPEDQTIDQVGALKSPALEVVTSKSGQQSAPTVDTYDSNRKRLLRVCLNKPHTLTSGPSSKVKKPVVGAPLYGQWYVDVDQVTGTHKWFTQLNEDPVFRIAAGFGSAVVREHQEEYMSMAWDQAGALEEVNRLLRAGQLSRATSNRIHRALRDDVGTGTSQELSRLLQFTRPVQGSLPDTESGTGDIGRSLKSKLTAEIAFPESVLSPAYRRLTAPRGALTRNANLSPRATGVPSSSPIPPTAFVDEFVSRRLTATDLEEELDPRVVSLDEMGMAFASLDPEFVFPDESGTAKAWPRQPLMGELDGGSPPSMTTRRIRDASDASMALSGSTDASGSAADGSAVQGGTVDPVGTGTIDTLPDDVLRIHRFGTWAQSLPSRQITPEEIRTAQPSDEGAFVLRNVDTQLESGIAHAKHSLDEIRKLSGASRSADGDVSATDGGSLGAPDIDPDQVKRASDSVRAVGTNTFEQLNRTLDNLLSTRPGAVPAAIENDKGSFVQGIVDHHQAATAALDRLRTDPETGERVDPGGDSPVDAGEVLGVHPGVDPNTGPSDFGDDQDLVSAAEAHMLEVLERLERLRGSINFGNEVLEPPADVGGVEEGGRPPIEDPRSILELLDPDVTIPETVLPKIDIDGTGVSGQEGSDSSGTSLRTRQDPLAPVSWAPSFDQPMFNPLRKLSEQYLMPGADDIPRDSIGALATNPAFIESFMVGLNHQFARELLWRRFPTNRSGTYFRKFWNDTGNPSATPEPDISKIQQWSNTDLGGNIGTPSVVLIVRGEVLRRFPNTSIYMARAKWTSNGRRVARVEEASHVTEEDASSKHIKFPNFRGNLDPDIAFMGFNLTPSEALGGSLPSGNVPEKIKEMDPGKRPKPGWFFVFEEPMGETRFGFDLAKDADGKKGTTGSTSNKKGSSPKGGKQSKPTPPMGIYENESNAKNKTPAKPVTEQRLTNQGEVAWNGLSWDHLTKGDPSNLTHVNVWNSVPGGNQDPSKGPITESNTWRVTREQAKKLHSKYKEIKPDLESSYAVWGRNSAHMARITFQRPVRVTIHADDLLADEAESDAWKSSQISEEGSE